MIDTFGKSTMTLFEKLTDISISAQKQMIELGIDSGKELAALMRIGEDLLESKVHPIDIASHYITEMTDFSSKTGILASDLQKEVLLDMSEAFKSAQEGFVKSGFKPFCAGGA